MSLRLQLVAIFSLVLLATLVVAAGLGLRIAQSAVETEINDSLTAVASSTALVLRKVGRDENALSAELGNLLRKHKLLLRAEIAFPSSLGIDSSFIAARPVESAAVNRERDVEYDRWRGPAPALPPSQHLDLPGLGRAVQVTFPFRFLLGGSDALGPGLKARLTLVGSLAESDTLATAERRAILEVAVGASLFLIIAFWLLLGRILVRRVGALADTMRAVEGGSLDVVAPGRAEGGDELAYLARGFNRMLAQLRGFNADLTRKIEDATAELTRKNRALEELNELLVAARRDLTAKERLAALGQLAGTIAHELGNPLNAVSGHVQLLARRPDLPEPAKAQVGIVQGEVARMAQVIRRFLDQTRGFTPVAETVRLDLLVDEALDLTLGVEARARIQVTREVAPDVLRVRTDPGLVRHLLTNLVANAVDAMPGGGALGVEARRDGADVVLRVADTGSGMPPDVKRHIFEPFYTTKPSGKGTGLGLAICKEIARGLKGRIDVESEPGKGSAFSVRFPAEPAPETRAEDTSGKPAVGNA